MTSGRCIAVAGLAAALLFTCCNLDGSEPEAQPQPAASASASAAPEPTPDRTAKLDQLRDENRQLMQALDVTLANQQDLANQLRKTNEALAEIRSDVALVRERLRDLELAQESHPLSQHAPAGAAAATAQQH